MDGQDLSQDTVEFMSPRDIARQIRTLVNSSPILAEKYNHTKNVVRAFRNPAFYEVATRCNLKCEGCYFFEATVPIIPDPYLAQNKWDDFFRAEAERGVTMAYFVGAEPALEQDRLLSAAEHFPYGNIGTNGTVKIDSAVPYRIGVSVWAGDDQDDKRLRGASVLRKALKNYAGDPRAIMLFTVSHWTIDQIQSVAEMCADNDLALTFNVYSPTQSFQEKLAGGIGPDSDFFRVSNAQANPILSAEDLERLRIEIDAVMDRFPEVVVYNKQYNNRMMQPGSRFELDPATGTALNCGSSVGGALRYFTTDLKERFPKCATPDIDCSECRMYSGGWSSRFMPTATDVGSAQSFEYWMGEMETLGQIFLYSGNDGRSPSFSPRF